MTKVNAIHCTLTPEEERAYVDWATERYGVELEEEIRYIEN